jgi:hypothetical protein
LIVVNARAAAVGDSYLLADTVPLLLWYPIGKVTTGVERLWGQREDKDGTSDDMRLQFSAKYEF